MEEERIMDATGLQESVRERVESLPAPNVVVMEVLRRSGNPDCTVKEISEVIAADASLTARILRLANSSYYGLPRRVEAVSVAVPLLGIRTIRRLVLSVSTYDIMNQKLGGYGHEEGQLWAHSLGVSVAAEHLCEIVGYRRSEELRMVALLHDIGKVVLSPFLLEFLESELREVLGRGGAEALELEREVCGLDHAEVGMMIAERWNLSPRFEEIIRYHHEPGKSPNLPKAAAIVNVADGVATWLLRSDELASAPLELDAGAMEALQLEEAEVVRELVEINRKMGEEIGFWLGYGSSVEEDSGR